MRKSTHTDIREALRKTPDGLTAMDICAMTGLRGDTVRQAMPSMPDVYIDRWEKTAKTKGYKATIWRAVYIAVPIPPNQPKPSNARLTQFRRMEPRNISEIRFGFVSTYASPAGGD